MANTKISQLPEWTGTAADLRWFVMNNSGETETFKYSGYTSPFRKADGFNSTISVYYNPNVVPNKLDMILGGTGNTMAATSSYTDGLGNSIVGGANNTMDLNGPAGGQQYGHSIFGGNANTLRWRANASVNTILGGQGNLMDCYYGGNTIIGGGSNTSQGSSNNTIIGANISIITGGDRNGIWGGYSQSVGGDYDCNIFGGFDNTISSGGFNTIVGSQASTISTNSFNTSIWGGNNNLVDASNYSQILGGLNNTINCETAGNERFNTIINGSGNTIFDAADDQTLQTIINSVDTTLQNGTQRVTAIGLSGRTINDASAGITYVETLKAFSQVVEGFYDNGTMTSGAGPAITINLNNGSKQSITITGGTNFIYFTGSIAGGRLVLKINNTGTGGINWADNDPYYWRLPASSPSNQPTYNAIDVFVFESFDTPALFLTTHSENLS